MHIGTENLLALAKDAINRGSYVEAFVVLNGIAALYQDFAPTYNFLGWIYDYEAADKSYRNHFL